MNLQDLLPDQRAKYLRAPDSHLDESKVSAFERIYQSTLRQEGRAPVVQYDCEYPKHEFLEYLVQHQNLLMHGSNEKNIQFLLPLRRSADTRAVGNLSAIYACSDGIWPIFFAVWDRRHYGATANCCFRAKDDDGMTRKFYGFSIATEGDDHVQPEGGDRPYWTDGMVYIVPMDSFKQLADEAGNLLEEWASTEPVAVLAKLPVSPKDFPFLEEVLISEGPLSAVAQPRATVDPKVFEAYVGRYVLSPDLVLNLEIKDARLFVTATGFPTVEMWPASETVYSLREINAQIDFVQNNDGEVTQLLLHVNGQSLPAIKV
jgi:hypothetical protein